MCKVGFEVCERRFAVAIQQRLHIRTYDIKHIVFDLELHFVDALGIQQCTEFQIRDDLPLVMNLQNITSWYEGK